MRILLDVQGAQGISKNRGIGRYTYELAMALVKAPREHEFHILLNGLYPESAETLRSSFAQFVDPHAIHVWEPPALIRFQNESARTRRLIAEKMYEAVVASIKPDLVHIFSIFEGYVDDIVSSIHTFVDKPKISVTLYDLIPLIYPDIYLSDPIILHGYMTQLEHLKRADMWLAISESSRQEAIKWLNLPDYRVVNVFSGVDNKFHSIELSQEDKQRLLARYGINGPFIMYTGGEDPRKNLTGLIQAYALLPKELIQQYQLVFVGKFTQAEVDRLQRVAHSRGLRTNDVNFIGYVADEDLVGLYNTCDLFVFPSLHEGFGLPVLEAMACGAAVIGSNNTSVREIINRSDALFDPHDYDGMSKKITEVLMDREYRQHLREYGLIRAKEFSWNKVAEFALRAFSKFESFTQKEVFGYSGRRLKLAYISPLPPQKTGIANYSVSLLKQLSRFYDITVIVNQENVTDPWIMAVCDIKQPEWFTDHFRRFDRVIYHFGNSEYHQYMFDLLQQIPGVVVLHDFFLSGILAHEEVNRMAGPVWTREIYKCIGYPGVKERFLSRDLKEIIERYPCNHSVIEQSLGIIVHSHHAQHLGQQWFTPETVSLWKVLPHLKALPTKIDRNAARRFLGYSANDFVVCSFGFLAPIKLIDTLIGSWKESRLSSEPECHLVLVGQPISDDYQRELKSLIGKQEQIRITGYVSPDLYEIYLQAADVAVQLREISHGETSGAVLDCLSYGIPTVVNSIGAFSEIPSNSIIRIEHPVNPQQLIEVLDTLYIEKALRHRYGENGREYIRLSHNPWEVGERFMEAIEDFYQPQNNLVNELLREVSKDGLTFQDLSSLAYSLGRTFSIPRKDVQILIDVSGLVSGTFKGVLAQVVLKITNQVLDLKRNGYRFEPIYHLNGTWRYARQFVLEKFLGVKTKVFEDDIVEIQQCDMFLGFDFLVPTSKVTSNHRSLFNDLKNKGG
ncbi:glycosyl transferase, group 1 [Sulfobacillus acidophilus TPY]|nr:glycosyl transferase, group 1 [Sulfobacillus acidophilus TPY]